MSTRWSDDAATARTQRHHIVRPLDRLPAQTEFAPTTQRFHPNVTIAA
ncbi:MAG TPA: hypothetical protein VKB50_11320 [Vicinamibacterales bacterium]|nr:hypothetical protein [Vicinamibacterales bacterium]